MIAEFADRVFSRRGHQQAVRQRADQHVGEHFEIDVFCQQPGDLRALQGPDKRPSSRQIGLDPTVVSPGAIWGAVRAWTSQAVFTSPTLYRV
jgi:hypothetical protein